jgi:hypothetical protein
MKELTALQIQRAMEKALQKSPLKVNVNVLTDPIVNWKKMVLNNSVTELTVPKNEYWEIFSAAIYHNTGTTTIYTILDQREAFSIIHFEIDTGEATNWYDLDLSKYKKTIIPPDFKIKKFGGTNSLLYALYVIHSF